jgi:prophage maintenance system killer protein
VKKFLAGMLVAHVFHKLNGIELTPDQEVKVEAALKKTRIKILDATEKGINRLVYGPNKDAWPPSVSKEN